MYFCAFCAAYISHLSSLLVYGICFISCHVISDRQKSINHSADIYDPYHNNFILPAALERLKKKIKGQSGALPSGLLIELLILSSLRSLHDNFNLIIRSDSYIEHSTQHSANPPSSLKFTPVFNQSASWSIPRRSFRINIPRSDRKIPAVRQLRQRAYAAAKVPLPQQVIIT